ncbi:MAG: MATE family efflux transporter [Oscillospiraceae bacterium]|nr:MATE family efflux transporter [Oscillospiraceae bacterium]
MAKDMTIGKPAGVLVRFAIPMIIGNLFQQLYNIVDSIIVGNFVGSDALAAVGVTSTITFLFVALGIGASLGASVVISQLFGAKKLAEMKNAIVTFLIAMVVFASVLTVLGLSLHRWILARMDTPANIFDDADSYLRIYIAGVLFLFCYNAFTAVFNAMGESRIPLYFLIGSSLLNVVLDLYFVAVLSMGVAGAAIATVISQVVSALMCGAVLLSRLRRIALPGRAAFDRHIFCTICRVAVPSTLQQCIVSLGMILIQSVVNGFGSAVIAGYSAAVKVDNLATAPLANISNAVSNYTAQNVGADKPERVRGGIIAALLLAGAMVVVVFLLLQLFPRALIGAFVDAAVTDPQVLSVGVRYLRIVACINVLFALMMVCNGVLKGAGDLRFFVCITLVNLFLRVLAAYALAPVIGWTAVCWSLLIGWGVGSALSLLRLRSGQWKTKKLV